MTTSGLGHLKFAVEIVQLSSGQFHQSIFKLPIQLKFWDCRKCIKYQLDLDANLSLTRATFGTVAIAQLAEKQRNNRWIADLVVSSIQEGILYYCW